MKNAARSGDQCDHPPMRLSKSMGSTNVFINDRRAIRTGDVHRCAEHGPERVRAGVPRVFINDHRAVGAIDWLLGGGVANRISTGSGDVFYGDDPFGMASRGSAKSWCEKLRAIKEKWASSTPQQRREMVAAATTAQAAELGMPPPTVTFDDDRTYAGALYPAEWNIRYSWRMLSKTKVDGARTPNIWRTKNPTETMFCALGSIVSHELRHAETAWYALRLLSDPARRKAMSKDELAWYLAHKEEVRRAAAESGPPAPGSAEALFAENGADDYFLNWSDCGTNVYANTPGGREAAVTHAGGCCGEIPDVWSPKPPPGGAIEGTKAPLNPKTARRRG